MKEPDAACPACTPSLNGAPAVAIVTDDRGEQELASMCKALAHPTRVRILKILMARTSCVCGDLVELLPVSQSTVSEHLRVLKQSGLVQGEVDGPRVCYCIHPVTLARFKHLIETL